jgi:hypothetical protein
MSTLTDSDLYRRGSETLLASWAEYARGSSGAGLHRLPGVAVAVFPNEPDTMAPTAASSTWRPLHGPGGADSPPR